jgi:ABC-type transport system substrate-binding protein
VANQVSDFPYDFGRSGNPTPAGRHEVSSIMVIVRWISCRAVVLLLVVCACLGSGCSERRARTQMDNSGPPVRGGTLEMVGLADVDHLATTSGYVSNTWWLFRTFARQLLAYPSADDYAIKTRPAPDVALEVPTRENGGVSSNGLTYTFHLRHGVHWDSSPPREVTAHDFVRAFKLFCNPVSPVGAPGYYTDTIVGMERYCEQFAQVPRTVSAIRDFINTQDLAGVRAADDFTVAFRLRVPAADFLNLVAVTFASPVPVEYLDYLPDSPEFRQHTLSNGPYRIARYIQNREMLLERNPAWDARTDPIRPAYVDQIRLRLGLDAQLKQLQIEAGTADLNFDEEVPLAERASLLDIGDPTAWTSPPGDNFATFIFLAVNHVGPNNREALKQLKVRRAIALAVDKAAVGQLYGGPRVARPLRQAVGSSAAGFQKGADYDLTPGDRGDVETARKMLARAGHPQGLSLSLAYPINGQMPLAAQSVQASLARSGIDLHLVPLNTNDFYSRLLMNPQNASQGKWDLALTGWIPDWFGKNNGRSVIAPLFDGRHLGLNTQNYGGYQSQEVNAAIDRAIAAPRVELAEQAWSDAARQLMNDVALVPLVEIKAVFARSRRVRGCTWAVFGMNCDLTSLWLADAAPKQGKSK